MQLTEQEQIDANEALDYQHEDGAGHGDGLLAALEAGETQDAPEPFVPDTAKKVDWVLREIARHRSDAARVRENMELIARESEREAERLEWQFGPALQTWLRSQIEGTSRRSKRLPNGVVGFRTKPAGVQVDDAAATLAWTQAHLPGALRVDKAALAKALLETGEVADGVTFVPAEETFYIK